MISTPVGMRCPECARERTRVTRMPTGLRAAAPYVTYGLIGVNALVFVAEILSAGGAAIEGASALTREGGLCGPAIGSGGICPLQGGAVVSPAGGEVYRLLTSGFLHAGPIHLALNMFVLYLLGSIVEPALGHARFAGLYVVSLFAGSFGALLLDPTRVTVGASGAIFGLMAAGFVIARQRGLPEVASQIGVLVAINLVITFSIASISVGGHIGGLVGGGIAALAIAYGERRGRRGLPIEITGLALVGVTSIAGALSAAAASSTF